MQESMLYGHREPSNTIYNMLNYEKRVVFSMLQVLGFFDVIKSYVCSTGHRATAETDRHDHHPAHLLE